MKYVRFASDATGVTFAGNKGARLARLHVAGFPVPAFFAIGTHAGSAKFDPELGDEIAQAANKLGARRVAVRSSSAEEDGSQRSFAGQFDSFLDVEPGQILPFASKVWQSAGGERIEAYRQCQGQSQGQSRGTVPGSAGDVPVPAVVVQKMVNADMAGVAFAADPVSGDRNTALVAAGRGVGEDLVSGETQGDTWHVARNGAIRRRELHGRTPVLNDRQIRAVAKLARAASEHFGFPQDIEWAIEGRHLYLLQSRDITTLGRHEVRDDYALWDNSNIVESYGGVTTPLTFSVARGAYQEAYRHFGRVLGVSRREIARHARAYEQMIGLIRGRVYYNLLNWYRLLMLTPGFRFNSKFMEQMMGVTDGLPKDVLPRRQDGGRLAAARATFGLVRVAGRLVAKLFGHSARVARFHQHLERALSPTDLRSMSLNGLVDLYEELEGEVIPAWETPLVNDLFCMIFHGALRTLCKQWLDGDNSGIHNDLVSGEAGIISMEPVTRMRRMAAIASGDTEFVQILRTGACDTIMRHVDSNATFRDEFEAYLRKFGDRCMDELKLESETVADNPQPLFRAVGELSLGRHNPGGQLTGINLRAAAEEKVAIQLSRSVFRRLVFGLTLKLARARVRDRENLRFERTRVYGRVRAIFVEIGDRLQALGVLAHRDGIFYLSVEEVVGIVRGTGSSGSFADLVASRRREFARYAAEDDPPRRFITVGPAQLPSSMQSAPSPEKPADGNTRRGQGCSPGIVRGPVRIVRDPKQANVRQGEILVAQRTDPGWVMIFPLVTGMVMERGSLLSHSAIVAREMGIPAVVAVEHACNWLSDGDWVELDGASGMVRKLVNPRRAA